MLQDALTHCFPHMPYHPFTLIREKYYYCCTEEELRPSVVVVPITSKAFTSDCLTVHQEPFNNLHRWTPLCLLQHSLHMVDIRWHAFDKHCIELDHMLCHILLAKNMIRAFPIACLSLFIKENILLSFSFKNLQEWILHIMTILVWRRKILMPFVLKCPDVQGFISYQDVHH